MAATFPYQLIVIVFIKVFSYCHVQYLNDNNVVKYRSEGTGKP